MRTGHPINRLRHDLLRRGQRPLFPTVRYSHEVHRKVPHTDYGSCSAFGPHRLAAYLEAEPRLTNCILRDLRTVGSGRCRVANTD